MKFIWLITLLIFLGCEKKQMLPNKVDIYNLTTAIDPSFKLIIPKDMNSGIKCADYGDGCQSGYSGTVLQLSMIFVEFDNEANALVAAQKIDGYIFKNWVFDDVTGEPELERFVIKAYGAQKARSILPK
jgi:hypothetical protein